MRGKAIWLLLGFLAMVALLAGSFGCASNEPSGTSPSITASSSPTSAGTSPSTSVKPAASTPASSSPAQAAKIRLRWQDSYSPGAPYQHWPYSGPALTTVNFKKFIESVSKGQVEIEILPIGAVVPATDVMKGVSRGVVDGACVNWPGYYSKEMPEANVELGLPFAWTKAQEWWDAWNYYGLKQEFQKIYREKYNILCLDTATNDIYNFGTTFPVNSPDAIKGKKIRATGIFGDLVTALGGSPTVIAAGDLYMGLKLGTIDGTIYGLSGLEDLKLKEVWKYYVIDPNMSTLSGGTIMNLDSFKKLPPDIQNLVENWWPYVQYACTSEYAELEAHMIASAKKGYGFTPVVWSDADKAKIFELGISLWDKVASQSADCARLVNIVKQQARDLGKIN